MKWRLLLAWLHDYLLFLFFQSNAELAVRDMLRDFARRRRQQARSLKVEAEDFMDDGTPIRLLVEIDGEEVGGEKVPMPKTDTD